MFFSLYSLASQQQSTYAFLKNEGIGWARGVHREMTAEALANAMRQVKNTPGDDIRAIARKDTTPKVVADGLNLLQMSQAHAIGTDGHRRLCRHEGDAYTALFGPPLEFCTPNLADGKQPILFRVQNKEFRLDATLDYE